MVNIVVVITLVGVTFQILIVLFKGNVVVEIDIVDIPILITKMFHIINLQTVMIVESGDMLLHNVNGSMKIFQGWLKNFVKWDSEILLIKNVL